MQCDALLINGNVIVNESMLTGESVPVTKVEFQSSSATEKLSIKEHNRHILFNGTQIVQLKYNNNQAIKAVVLRTGFNTTKGELVRAILYPKPVDFNFAHDTYKYVLSLTIVGVIGIAVTVALKAVKIAPDHLENDAVVGILDLFTTVIPPILPAALAAGVIYAQNSLAKSKIYCISPSTINISGTLNCFVFDKTGTLTEDGMDLKFIQPSTNGAFGQASDKIENIKNNSLDLFWAMASCHSLIFLNGKISGDPLDLKLFEFTKSELTEPSNSFNEFRHPVTSIVHTTNKVLISF
jgi:cation-transporting ATPase 13A2